jgi:hypothetical protein
MRFTTKMLSAAAAAIAVSATGAQAQDLTYCTQYSFTNTFLNNTCGTGDQITITNGVNTATLTFAGQAATLVTGPTNIDYGTVTVSAASGSPRPVDGTSIYLRILQFAPAVPGQTTVLGTMSGSIGLTQSTAIINWNNPSRVATINNVVYEVEALSMGRTSINSQTSGAQTIRGTVAVIPEPSTYALMGSGLAGLLGVASRRRRAVA